MVAYLGAQMQGEGQHIDVSFMEAMLVTIRRASQMMGYQWNQETTPRDDPRGGLGVGIIPCADGFMGLLMIPFTKLYTMMGRPELLDDPAYNNPIIGLIDEQKKEEINAMLLEWSIQHTMRECVSAGQEAGVLCSPARR